MSRFRFLAFVLAMLAPCAAAAEPPLRPIQPQVRVHIFPVRTVQLETLSNIAVTGSIAIIGEKQRDRFMCVSFVNNDRRIATAITFHFDYFDRLGNHAGENELVRSGRFSQGVAIESADMNTGLANVAECASMPYSDRGRVANLVYVTSVTYGDGTIWNASGIVVPEHLPVSNAQ